MGRDRRDHRRADRIWATRLLPFWIGASSALLVPGEAVTAESREYHPVSGVGQMNRGDRGYSPVAPVAADAPRIVPFMPGPHNYYDGPVPREAPAPAGPEELEAPVSETAAPSPLGIDFEGIGYTGFAPPDPHLGAGPNSLVEVVNGAIRLIDKATGASLVQRTLNGFFNGSLGFFTFDPNILYDPHSNRFFTVAVDGFSGFNSWLRVALSKAPDPGNLSVGPDATDDWCGFDIDADLDGGVQVNQNWADFPRVGVDRHNFYVTANMYSNGGIFQYSKLWVIRKSALLSCTESITIFEFGAPPGPLLSNPVTTAKDFTITPAINHDFAELRMLATNSLGGMGADGFITSWTINDPGGTPSLTAINVNVPGWNSFTVPDCDQLGNIKPIHTGDTRVLHVVQRQGSLWATHTQPNAAGTLTEVRWYELIPATGTVRQTGTVTDPERCYFFPAMQPDPHKNVTLVFSGVSSDIYGSAFYTSRKATDPLNFMATPQATLKSGERNYVRPDSRNQNRWGDFGGISEDPLTKETWMVHEYARQDPAGPNRWSTWIGKVAPSRAVDTVPTLTWWGAAALLALLGLGAIYFLRIRPGRESQ